MFSLIFASFPADTLPVEAKPVWHKQAIELEEEVTASEEPTWVPALNNKKLNCLSDS